MQSGDNSPQSYISQSEASSLAGVSAATLLRFAEAGYFRVVQQNGVAKFSKQEICEVFGPAITATTQLNSGAEQEINPESNQQKAEAETSVSKESIQPTEVHSTGGQFLNNETASTDNTIQAATESDDSSRLNERVEKIIEQPLKASEPNSIGPTSIGPTSIGPAFIESHFDRSSSEIITESREMVELFNSQARDTFKKVLQLQEELLAQKEAKIQDLIKEREWLRSRLEKMEDKSDRDQMLLMVESQKVRTLIDRSQQKSGIMRLALGWLGGNKSESQTNTESNKNSKE